MLNNANSKAIHRINLFPHEINSSYTKKLLQQAEILPETNLHTLNIIYIMDIIEYSPVFRSLTIDTLGRFWISKRSTKWIFDNYSKKYGYPYNTWNNYLKSSLNIQKQHVPYVIGEHIFLRITNTTKHYDWINVGYSKDFEIVGSFQNCDKCCNFHFELGLEKSSLLTISLSKNIRSLTEQLSFGIHLSQSWQIYYKKTITEIFTSLSLTEAPSLFDKWDLLLLVNKNKIDIPDNLIKNFIVHSSRTVS